MHWVSEKCPFKSFHVHSTWQHACTNQISRLKNSLLSQSFKSSLSDISKGHGSKFIQVWNSRLFGYSFIILVWLYFELISMCVIVKEAHFSFSYGLSTFLKFNVRFYHFFMQIMSIFRLIQKCKNPGINWGLP